MMEYVNLGRAGVKVSRICLGTAFRTQWDDAVCRQVIDRAIDLDINFIDTSNVYGEDRIDHAEKIIGQALRGRRDQCVIALKIFNPVGPGPNDWGLSRVHLVREIERSLRKLQTDYVDILLMHEPDPTTPLEETLRTLDDMIHQGKVRYIGCSRFYAWQVCKAQWICDQLNLTPLSCVQNRYNLFFREAESELLPFLHEGGLAFMVYSPLAIGLLSGRFKEGQPPPKDTPWGQGYVGYDKIMTEQAWNVVDILSKIGQAWDKTLPQVAIAWILSHPEVTSVIIGPDWPQQVDENVGAIGWSLAEEEREALDEAARKVHPDIPFR
jgi:aryl-alcohol dehydrogenase-like predicted oxidoreductase